MASTYTTDEHACDSSGSVWSDAPEIQEGNEDRKVTTSDVGKPLPTAYNDRRNGQDTRRADIYTELLKAPPRRAFVHDVYRCEDEKKAFKLADGIYGSRRGKQVPTELRKKGFTYVSLHASESSTESFNHIHVIHDCRWKDSTCRCGAFTGFRLAPFYRRRVKYLSTLSSEDLRLLSIYVLQEGKLQVLFEIAGNRRQFYCEAGDLQNE